MDVIGAEKLSHLLDAHGASLVLYAQQWCREPEDAVQVAFLRLMRQRPVPDNIVGWLYRVVRNEAITVTRAAVRRDRHESAAGSGRQPWFEATCGDGLDGLDAESAKAALERLAINEREVVVLRLWSGLAFEEIAELIGKSTSTAHRRYAAGLVALRKQFDMRSPDSKEPRL